MATASNNPMFSRTLATLSSVFATLIYPTMTFAHETEHLAVLAPDEQTNAQFALGTDWLGIPLDVWAISGMAVTVMLAAFYIFRFSPWLPFSKRTYRQGYRYSWIAVTLIALFFTLTTGILSNQQSENSSAAFQIPHIHGLGFSPDGQQLYVPVHEGILSFHHGRWEKPDGALHDYMGFAVADHGFYSSGHPEPGSDLPNPLGWLRSETPGAAPQQLALLGEADFHLTAVGYHSHVQYVQAMEPNALMPLAGLIYRSEDGQKWKPVALEGIQGNLLSISAHPDDPAQLAVSTTDGYWISRDGGASVQLFASRLTGNGEQPGIVYYSPSGDLFVALKNANGQAEFYRWRMKDDDGVKQYTPPNVMQDIIYLAQHPEQPDTLAFATADLDLYYTTDRGDNWLKIISKGQALNGEVTLQEMPLLRSSTTEDAANPADGTHTEHDHGGAQ